MRYLLYILILCASLVKAQDKLIYNDGSIKTGIIMSIGKDILYFKLTDTSQTERINKADLILAEDYKGNRYVFGRDAVAPTSHSLSPKAKGGPYRNTLGVLPFNSLVGRFTLAYEHLNEDGSIGLVFPVSLSYNPYGVSTVDTITTLKRKGVNVIGGVDLNFYFGDSPTSKIFIGPRVRYGTDVLLLNSQICTIQTQFGLKFEEPEKRFVQHVSIGFGFLRIISSSGFARTKQSFACFSFNYRVGIKW